MIRKEIEAKIVVNHKVHIGRAGGEVARSEGLAVAPIAHFVRKAHSPGWEPGRGFTRWPDSGKVKRTGMRQG